MPFLSINDIIKLRQGQLCDEYNEQENTFRKFLNEQRKIITSKKVFNKSCVKKTL